MRLTTILVEHFQALIRVEVAFGPGLNVLYGPNDFGKSTLAHAIRAALLVVPTSSASAPFQPWYEDVVPRVTLSFEDNESHQWRVKKTFETSAQSGSAELYHSKDGVTYTLDAKGRAVEDRLREILGWGIAAPGGKGSPRGLPESFLTHTLLAAQTDVDRILGESLAEDGTDTGKLKLGKALATLAQDPLFKRVLDAAQCEVDACFTAKGLRKRGQGSRFVEAGRVVKTYEAQLAAAQKVREETAASAERVTALRSQQLEQMDAVGDALAALNGVRERLKRWREREAADGTLRAARDALAHIDERAAELVGAAAEVETLTAALRSADDALVRSAAECEAADATFRTREEAHRLATSEDGARERGLRLAEIKTERAENHSIIQAVEARRAKVEEAISAGRVANETRGTVSRAREDLEKATREDSRVQDEVVDLEKALDFAKRLTEYGHWKAAALSLREATEAATNAAKNREEADAKQREADAATEETLRIETESLAAAARLPTSERLKALLQLEREVERVEAALVGGLTVVLRPRKPVSALAVVDQTVALDERALEGERLLEAERSMRLTIGDLIEVDITAGAAEKRRELAVLRSRWESEATPVLAASGLVSLSAVDDATKALAGDRQRAETSRQRAQTLRAKAHELRERAALHDERSAKLADAKSNLDAREAAIRGHDPAPLEERFATLGTSWEPQVTTLCARTEKALVEARTREGHLKNARGIAVYKASDAEGRAAAAAETATALAKSLETVDLDSLLRSVMQELTKLLVRRKELAERMDALANEAAGEVERTSKGVEAARVRVAAAKDSHAIAAAQREKVLAERSGRAGHRDLLKAQLEAMDRSAAAHNVKEREGELTAFACDTTTSDADVREAQSRLETAQRGLDGVKTELHHAEGALSKVGGMPALEEVERLQDAIECARAREQDLEEDADAYKLLVETLREVENAEGAHLGRALSGPVGIRFRELTEGRYGDLSLTPALQTEGVRPAGAGPGHVLDALSVGTREQLATLIRLAIAEQLRSVIVLDDQLVQSDPKRLAWFREILRRASLHAQVVVLTCRPEDYLGADELPNETAVRDLAGGTIRAIDFARAAKRWTPAPSQAVTRGSDRPRASVPPNTREGVG
jgi:hypothetical protein